MNKLISIIIPIYNRSTIVSKTLDTIKAQTYTHWECILVDDGSTDNTLDVLENYRNSDARFKVFIRPNSVQKGANGCRNYGFNQANGDYVNWFDSDDIMLPDFLKEKVMSFSSSVNAVINRNAYGNADFSQFRDSKFDYQLDNLFENYALETIELQTCSFMWQRTYLLNKMLFDETLHRYQDNEFHIRMLALQPKLKVLNQVLAHIRGGNSDDTQISSVKKETSKKLLDIFYYRFQCLKLAYNTHFLNDKYHKCLITKKGLWVFYSALKKEASFKIRIKQLKTYQKQLRFLYQHGSLSLTEKIKSQLLILKLCLFR
ncbi:glycosyltransferase family 2 protein [Mesoflavibacter zeaxanthinifaciens]|uniref:glycosyltransferase family 2 protein n=1 Tax=Mesoflavibacter zeaxanthinifaciens TaxID=393060 RepID=UPI000404996F|nr:glycosyltransferase family 2 protein [Mesoflavibacter zeaxanthinifaciens]